MTNFVEYKISVSFWTFFTEIWFTCMVFFYVVNGTFIFFRVQEWSVGAMPRLSQIAQSYFPQIIKCILLFIFLICTELDQVEYFTNSDRKRFKLLLERPGKNIVYSFCATRCKTHLQIEKFHWNENPALPPDLFHMNISKRFDILPTLLFRSSKN